MFTKFLMIVLGIGSASTAFATDRHLQTLNGILQFEAPCVLAAFPDGCLRILTVTRGAPTGIYYIQRPDHAPSAEFNRIPLFQGVDGYQIHFGPVLSSVLLTHNQPVRIRGDILVSGESGNTGGTVLRIDGITLTGHLQNPALDSTPRPPVPRLP